LASLNLTLPAALLSGQFISISLDYLIVLPNQASTLGAYGQQINLGDWYPYIPPYQEPGGWVYHQPNGIGESLVYPVAEFELFLSFLNPWKDITIAASTPLAPNNGIWHGIAVARNITISISPEYRLFEKTSQGIDIKVYLFSYHAQHGQAVLNTIEKAVALYTRLYAPYPHSSLTMVEGIFPDGMEYDGLFFLGSEYFYSYNGSPKSYLITLTAHETAHQWWYGLVGSDPALEPWLDEAQCTYSELLFYENTDPDLVGWWWDFRVNYYNPRGTVNGTIYDYSGFRPYVNSIYLQGARFLHELRLRIGDKEFFASLQEEATNYAGKIINSSNFFEIISHHSQYNWSDMKATYFK
jgi:hypothetical protein